MIEILFRSKFLVIRAAENEYDISIAAALDWSNNSPRPQISVFISLALYFTYDSYMLSN